MALFPTDQSLGDLISSKLMDASQWVGHHFHGANGGVTAQAIDAQAALPMESLPLIDERLRPRAPMVAEEIEILTRLQLSNNGFRHARLINAQSHPELYAAWGALCRRAGHHGPMPQLILTESSIPNAMELHSGEMVVTSGLLQRLNMREVIAVLGHELGHSRHEHGMVRGTAMAFFAGMGALLGNFVGKVGGIGPVASTGLHKLGKPGRLAADFLFGPHREGPASLLGSAAYIGMGAATGLMVANQITVKPTELQADIDGTIISGDPDALISALEKLHASDTRKGLGRWFGYLKSGYPTMEQRIEVIRKVGAEQSGQPLPEVLAPVGRPAPESAQPLAKVHEVTLGDRVAAPDTAMAAENAR